MQRSIYPAIPLEADNLAWGCVFCETGAEARVSNQLAGMEGIRIAFAVKQMQHRSQRGVRSEVERVMLPGYVFFLAERDMQRYRLLRGNDRILRVLSYREAWALRGEDLAFARWMYAHGGVLEISRARKVGDRVTIIDGPLKELEGVILKVDRHNRNGLVSIQFGGKSTNVWLAFEYIAEERA